MLNSMVSSAERLDRGERTIEFEKPEGFVQLDAPLRCEMWPMTPEEPALADGPAPPSTRPDRDAPAPPRGSPGGR